MTKERIPPSDVEAEASVLGSMMRDNRVVADVLLIVREDHFYSYQHNLIFQAMIELWDHGKPIDTITLADELKRRNQIDGAGGYPPLAELWDAAPTAANALHHAAIVKSLASLRALIHSSQENLREAYDANAPALDMRRPRREDDRVRVYTGIRLRNSMVAMTKNENEDRIAPAV